MYLLSDAVSGDCSDTIIFAFLYIGGFSVRKELALRKEQIIFFKFFKSYNGGIHLSGK